MTAWIPCRGVASALGGRAMLPRAALLLAGAVQAGMPAAAGAGVDVEGGVTLVGLAGDDGRVDDDATISGDLFLAVPGGRGRWTFYFEGSSGRSPVRVSTLLPETNADAGTAREADGGGRLQVSELKWTMPAGTRGELTFGLVDLTAYLDTNRTNNDENMQFLGTSFLNNPAIEFPDYTPGIVFHQEAAGARPAVHLALAGSNGLADNPGASYEELVEVDEAGKGVFAGAEIAWHTHRWNGRAGGWYNGRDLPRFEGGEAAGNRGGYVILEHSAVRHSFGVRAGIADESVSRVAWFASLTWQRRWSRAELGLGLARTEESDRVREPRTGDIVQAESYLRWELRPRLYLTPSIQFLRNSAFDASDTVRPDRAWVLALRLRWRF